MPFKRTYDVPGEQDLYVTVLVECENCGMQDTLADDYTVEYVNDQFNSVEDIDVHADCPLCGKHLWAERMEHSRLGIPEQLSPKDYTVSTMDSLVSEVASFQQKLEIAQENGFVVRAVLQDEGTIVLTKDC